MMSLCSIPVQLDVSTTLGQGLGGRGEPLRRRLRPTQQDGGQARQGRKCGKAKEVFLLRLENVFSFVVRKLQRILNVGLLRLAATAAKAFSSPFACSSPSSLIRLGFVGGKYTPPPLRLLEVVAGECFQSFASISNRGLVIRISGVGRK